MENDQNQNHSRNTEANNPQPTEGDKTRTSLGINENLTGLLCYVFGWITGLIFLLIEKDSKFVKFHAVQSFVLGIAFTLIYFILDKLLLVVFWYYWPMISLITSLAELSYLLVSVFLALKAYQMQWYELPIIGNIAKNVAEK